MDLDLSHGLCRIRKLTQDELFIQAKINHYNTECYRPTFLIRIHKLNFKRVAYGGIISKSYFQTDDLTINIRRGENYNIGQPDSFYKAQEFWHSIDEKDNTVKNLFGVSHSPFVSDKHFAVGREEEDDKVWIRDLNSKHGTYVNGTKLIPQINHKLQEGDIISLGFSQLNAKYHLDKELFWVFKYREVPKDEETQLKTLYSQVLGNTVILSQILTIIYDPYKHLRDGRQRIALTNIRTVSKFWDEISIPILSKKLELHLKVNEQRLKFGAEYQEIPLNRKESLDIWTKRFNVNRLFFSYMRLRKIIIKEDPIVCFTTEIRATEVKLFEQFFRIHRNQITKLVLWFSIEPEAKKHKNREKVLQSLFKECKSIKEFKILEDCSKSLANVEPSTPTKKLTIHSKIASYENLFRTFLNIVEITLGSICMETFFLFMAKSSNRNFVQEALKHLKVLKMPPVLPCKEVLYLLFNISEFPIKIEEFLFQNVPLEELPNDIILIVIKGFKDSLKTFKLTFATSQRLIIAGIRLPKMEKLEKLEISLNNPNVLKWNFEVGGFPNLEVINFKTDRKKVAECDTSNVLESLLSVENRKYFPKLENAYISYGQLQSKNFAYFDAE